jgi:tRNA G18 (ribose-2'-O)-methylase SpoU
MASFINVTDIDDERIAIYRSLKGRQLAREGAFIAEGPKVVKALVKSGIKIISCLTTEYFYKKFRPALLKLAKNKVPVYLMPREGVEKVIGFSFHQGLMVACRIPPKPSPERVLKGLKKPHLLIALNGVNDPENVGLIARNMAAFGASAMIVDRKTYDPYYRRAVRVSMGAIFGFSVIYAEELSPLFKWLKGTFGTRIIATHLGPGSKEIDDVDLTRNVCVVFGNEDKGVDKAALAASDIAVRIPMTRGVDSLNVACASSIILREAFMSRGKGPGSRGQGKGKK